MSTMTHKSPTPQELARQALARMKPLANPEKAAQAQKYFKETVRTFGISSPVIRALAKELYQSIKDAWSLDDALKLCDILLPNPYLDAKGLATLILLRFKNQFTKDVLLKIKSWLLANCCDNWASVDVLCPDAIGALIEKFPEVQAEIQTWVRSPNRWVRRASAVSFIKLARHKNYQDIIYKISRDLFYDQDDLIQKANGWLLREVGKRDMARLEAFLLRNGPQIPRTTLRYAIEKFDSSRRVRLLAQTRAK
jgi:3-methyladenine DNA glycosylase AlkD